MDIARIKSSVIMFFSRMGSYVRAMFGLPYFKRYALLSVFLTLLFIVFTFPYGELVISRLKKMEGKAIRTIDIGDLDISLLGTSTAESISVVPSSGDELTVQQALLDGNINPYSLLVSKHFTGSLSLKNMAYRTPRVELDSNINCNYDVALTSEGSGIDKGTIKIIMERTALRISELELPSSFGGMKLSLPPMKFSSVIMNYSMQKDTVTIQQLKLSGADLQGTVTGTIGIARMFLNSKLNITISVESDSAVLESYRDMLGSFTNADGEIVLNVEGTLSRPRFQKPGTTGGDDED